MIVGVVIALGGIKASDDVEYQAVEHETAKHYGATQADCRPHVKSARSGDVNTYHCTVRYSDGRTTRDTVVVRNVTQDVPCNNDPNTHCNEDFRNLTFYPAGSRRGRQTGSRGSRRN